MIKDNGHEFKERMCEACKDPHKVFTCKKCGFECWENDEEPWTDENLCEAITISKTL